MTMPTKPATVLLLGAALALPALAAGEADPIRIPLTNVNVLARVNGQPAENASVLVGNDLIAQVTTDAIAVDGATVIDGGGRTLMPGPTDAHWQIIDAGLESLDQIRTFGADYLQARAPDEAEKTSLRGFTTARNMGGGGLGIERAIDEGLDPGPRTLLGAHISALTAAMPSTRRVGTALAASARRWTASNKWK